MDLLQGDRAGSVEVHLLEESVQGGDVLLAQLHLLLHEELPVHPRCLEGVVDEDAGDDVQHREDDKGDVEEEEAGGEEVHRHECVGDDTPAHTAQHGLDEAVDRAPQRAKLPVHLRCHGLAVAGVLLEVVGGLQGEPYGKHVDDHDEQEQGPEQRAEGVHDEEREERQLPEEAEDAEDADDSEHLENLQDGAAALGNGPCAAPS
mmetsp:Transcript_77831/g.241177  ORF Transcript_77831/g.241177 Transcript_77831/m.241177 type:complete len:204 (+) Transcript_77831:314-925(+)